MYLVLELQTNTNGQVASLINQYDTQAAADNKYHTVLAAAAISQLPVHAAVMLTNEGYVIKNEVYNRPIIPEEGEIA